jgi:hypothetical protein
MTEKTRVQIFIAMNENGDWEVGGTAHEAGELIIQNERTKMIRIAVIDVNMAPPQLADGGEVTIPDEAKVEAIPGELPEASRASQYSG